MKSAYATFGMTYKLELAIDPSQESIGGSRSVGLCGGSLGTGHGYLYWYGQLEGQSRAWSPKLILRWWMPWIGGCTYVRRCSWTFNCHFALNCSTIWVKNTTSKQSVCVAHHGAQGHVGKCGTHICHLVWALWWKVSVPLKAWSCLPTQNSTTTPQYIQSQLHDRHFYANVDVSKNASLSKIPEWPNTISNLSWERPNSPMGPSTFVPIPTKSKGKMKIYDMISFLETAGSEYQ